MLEAKSLANSYPTSMTIQFLLNGHSFLKHPIVIYSGNLGSFILKLIIVYDNDNGWHLLLTSDAASYAGWTSEAFQDCHYK